MNFKWKQYYDIFEFEKEVSADLFFNKYQNSIILRIIKRIKDQKIDETIRLITVSDYTKNRMIGFQTLPHQMIYYFCDDQYDEDILNFYIDNVIANGWELHQIMGDDSSAKRFAEIYSQKADKVFHERERLIGYKLCKLCKPMMPEGNFRECTFEDMNILPYWGAAFYEECDLDDVGKKLEYHFERIPNNIGEYYFWEVNGRPVCMTSVGEVSEDCLKISSVYTPPHARGKGYAFANVWNVCYKYKDQYSDIMLYANADYPQSNKVYRKIGFQEVFTNTQYTFFEKK